MQDIITLKEAATMLGYEKMNEAKSWLQWQSIKVTAVANNSFLLKAEFELAIQRIIHRAEIEEGEYKDAEKPNKKQIEKPTYIPIGKAEKFFYEKLIKKLADNKKTR